MIVKPKIRGFICVTAHPKGCQKHVEEEINYVQSQEIIANGPKKVLIIGASTGYGLSSRIVSAFGCSADTLGVFFERPSTNGKPASAGWYNSVAFENVAKEKGLYAKSINGDAFSDEIKEQVISTIKNEMGGKVDLVIYSLASPLRKDPKTGEVYRSVLKTIGEPFSNKTLNTDKATVEEVSIAPSTEEELEATRKVMGGEDWQLWMDALLEADVLAEGAKTVAYSYIGPKVTWPIYYNGTIGKAKEHLAQTAVNINKQLSELGGSAYVSVNKAVVTQASSAIPVVPLYLSILFKVMKEMNIDEDCIHQIYRLFKTKLYINGLPELDAEGQIRVDDWEMRNDVQQAIEELWPKVNTETLDTLTDFSEYQKKFLNLFGFGYEGVDYEEDVAVELDLK